MPGLHVAPNVLVLGSDARVDLVVDASTSEFVFAVEKHAQRER